MKVLYDSQDTALETEVRIVYPEDRLPSPAVEVVFKMPVRHVVTPDCSTVTSFTVILTPGEAALLARQIRESWLEA